MRFLAGLSLMLTFSVNGLGQSQTSSPNLASCGVDLRWLNTDGTLDHARSLQTPESLSLLVHLSRGEGCSVAEVNVTATFLTESQDFICSGTIRSAMSVSSQVQVLNVAIRPFMQLDFLRWRNQPGSRGEQQGKRLVCMNLDGTTDLGDIDRQKGGWMRLSIGVIPAAGGLSVTEAIVRFVP